MHFGSVNVVQCIDVFGMCSKLNPLRLLEHTKHTHENREEKGNRTNTLIRIEKTKGKRTRDMVIQSEILHFTHTSLLFIN